MSAFTLTVASPENLQLATSDGGSIAVQPVPGGGGGSGGITGSQTIGQSTLTIGFSDWSGTLSPTQVFDLFTVSPPLAPGEEIEMAATGQMRSAGGADYGNFAERIFVQDVGGVIQTPAGGTSGSDVTVPAAPQNITAGLAGATFALVVTGGTVAIRFRAPDAESVTVGAVWTYIRRLPPVVSPNAPHIGTLVPLLDVSPFEGGAQLHLTGGSNLNIGSPVFTVGGHTATVVSNDGVNVVLDAPASTASVNGGFAVVQVTTSFGTDSLAGSSGAYYLPEGTFAAFTPKFGTTPASPGNGTLLSQWTDLLGVHLDVQATAANQPPFQTGSINGEPTIEFTQAGGSGGVPQWMLGTFASTITVTKLTMILIGKRNVDSSGGPWILAAWPTGLSGLAGISGGNSPIMIDQNGNVITNIEAFFAGGPLGVGPAFASGTPVVASIRWDGTNETTRVNGIDGIPVASSLGAGIPLNNFTICSGGDALSTVKVPTSWSVGMVIFCNHDYSTADYASLSQYTDKIWLIPQA